MRKQKNKNTFHSPGWLGWLIWPIRVVTLVCAGLTFCLLERFPVQFLAKYQQFQASFFTGFLTLSGLLLTSKIFIVGNLKKELYESKEYQSRIREHDLEKNVTTDRFQPLCNVQRAMVIAVLVSLVASLVQITVGMLPFPYAKATAVFFVVCAFGAAIHSLVILQISTRAWFQQMRLNAENADREIEKENEAKRTQAQENMKRLEQEAAESGTPMKLNIRESESE